MPTVDPHHAAQMFRASLILFAGMGAMLALAVLLAFGHWRGHYNAWKVWIDFRTKQMGWRLVAESFAFIASTTAMFIFAVQGGETGVWTFYGYLGTWTGRSLLGPLVAAKAQMMGNTAQVTTTKAATTTTTSTTPESD